MLGRTGFSFERGHVVAETRQELAIQREGLEGQSIGIIKENTLMPSEAGVANLPVVRANTTTINDLVDLSCSQFGIHPAIGIAQEPPLSYSSLHEHIFALALRLRQAGVGEGSRVAILGGNSHCWAIAYLAVVRLRASVVPVFPETPEADVHHILGQAGCDTLFISKRQLEKIYDLKRPLQTLIGLDDCRDKTGLLHPIPFSAFLQEGFLLLQSDQPQDFHRLQGHGLIYHRYEHAYSL